MIAMMEELFTAKEAARALKISEYTVIRLIKDGDLRASKIGNSWRIRHSDLQAYIDARSNKHQKK